MQPRMQQPYSDKKTPENGLLNEQDVAAGFLHLFDDIENVLSLVT